MKPRLRFPFVAAAALLAGASLHAQSVTATGDVDPLPPSSITTWTTDFTAGVSSAGTLTVAGGGWVSVGFAQIGLYSGSSGRVDVSGDSTFRVANNLQIGWSGFGVLNGSDGADMRANVVLLGLEAGSSGSVILFGSGTKLRTTDELTVGRSGDGRINIYSGSLLNAEATIALGAETGGTGTISLTGGSVIQSAGETHIGVAGTGMVSIRDGSSFSSWSGGILGVAAGGKGTLDVANGSWSSSALYVGDVSSGILKIGADGDVSSNGMATLGSRSTATGTATVSGAGARWHAGGGLYVGYEGAGTATVDTGGTVEASSLVIGYRTGATGTFTLGAGGVLAVGGLSVGDGSGKFLWNGGTIRATAASGDFIRNFAAGAILVSGTGATIDTNGFDVGVSANFQFAGGAGRISKTGAGKLTFGGAMPGGLAMNGGDLAVTSSGTITGADGTTGAGEAGVLRQTSGNVSNAGAIKGGKGATLSSGAAPGGGAGFSIAAGTVSGTVVNDGTITGGEGGVMNSVAGQSYGGAGGAGVDDAGNFTNNGAITGGAGVYGVLGVGAGGVGFNAYGATLVNNASGTISGGLSGTGVRAGGIRFSDAAGTLTNAGRIVGDVTMDNFANSVTLVTGGSIVGNLNLGTAASARLTLAGDSGTQSLAGAVTGAIINNGALIKTGAGTWTIDRSLAHARTFVTGGALLVGSGGALLHASGDMTVGVNDGDAGTLTISGAGKVVADAVVVAQSSVSSGTLNFGSYDLANATGSGTLDAPTIAFGAGAGVINFNQNDALTLAAVISGNGALNQRGSGTTTLSGANTFAGKTTVSGGTLEVTGTLRINGDAGITVASGATLALSGTLLASGDTDTLSNAGSLVLGGALDLGGHFDGFNGGASGSYLLITSGSSGVSGNFSGIAGYDTGAWSVVFDNASGNLVFTAVPEPSTYGLLGAGLLAGLAMVKRRRRSGEKRRGVVFTDISSAKTDVSS